MIDMKIVNKLLEKERQISKNNDMNIKKAINQRDIKEASRIVDEDKKVKEKLNTIIEFIRNYNDVIRERDKYTS